jgi:hypothetical protein
MHINTHVYTSFFLFIILSPPSPNTVAFELGIEGWERIGRHGYGKGFHCGGITMLKCTRVGNLTVCAVRRTSTCYTFGSEQGSSERKGWTDGVVRMNLSP